MRREEPAEKKMRQQETSRSASAGQQEQGEAPIESSLRPQPPAERFLQHALGTQGDVRLPSLLLSLAAAAAVTAVGLKRRRRRREEQQEASRKASRRAN